jgi:glycolate oxidase iron-sulfur subunit
VATELQRVIQDQEENLLACVHCGLCLPHCPTYAVLGDENDSPRGRLYLMRAVADGRLQPDAVYTKHIEACIVCRACETACPSGVQYSHIMQTARAELRASNLNDVGILARTLRWIGLNVLISRRWLLKPVVWPMRLLRHFRPSSGWPKVIPGRMRQSLEMLPDPPPSRPSPRSVSSDVTRRVVQFRGCVMDELYRDVNESTTRVLKVNGCSVDQPGDQVCCGALHDHSGYVGSAEMLARRNIDAFDDGTNDPIIINAAGCGAMLKEYGSLLAGDIEYATRAVAFSERVKDIYEYLAGIASTDEGLAAGAPVDGVVTYDAPCHLYHAQRIKDAPLTVLDTIPELNLKQLSGFDRCCGSGGIYSLTHADIADEVLAEKLTAIRETGATTLATANPGCQMQIQSGARMNGMDLRVRHVVDILDESYSRAGLYG